jgi:hypothetical protein
MAPSDPPAAWKPSWNWISPHRTTPCRKTATIVYEIRWNVTYASTSSRQIYKAMHFQLILHSAATGTDAVVDEFKRYHASPRNPATP